jgi:ferredoxin
MAEYKVNKEKCIGCGLCVTECSDGTELKDDGKAEVIDSQKLEECGGEKVCPYGAIEIEKEEE